MYDTIIFDLDGVIIDSETYYCKSIYNFFLSEGYPISQQASYQYAGLSPARGESLTKKLLGDSLGADLWHRHLNQVLNNPLDYKSIVIPGVISLLDFSKMHSLKIGLASSGIRNNILNVLNILNISDYFDFVITGDDVANSKPDPEIYIRAAEYLNTSTDRCIVIEDSAPGITAAVQAGAYVIAKKDTRFGHSQELADIVCDNMYSIKSHIESLL